MDTKFTVNKGVPQGSVLSPHLFNVHLENILRSSGVLSKAIDAGKLIAFADDVLLIADTKTEAINLIEEMNKLESHGLQLNKDKSHILSNNRETDDLTEIEGVAIKSTVKYLGMKLSCSRDTLKKDAKAACKKYLAFIRGKIQTENEHLSRIIHATFYRNLMIYFFTPLVASGVMSEKEVNNFEAYLKRRQHLLPNDIKSSVINNVCEMFTKSAATLIVE